VAITIELFDSKEVQTWFKEFSLWLKGAIGIEAAAIKINNYLHFFEVIDHNPRSWNQDLPALTKLSKGELRKDGNPIKFFKTKGFEVSSPLLAEVSTHRSINNSLNVLERESTFFFGHTLTNYCEYCLQKHRRRGTKSRTLKQQLAAVVSLIQHLKRTSKPLTDRSLAHFLARYPGWKASLLHFVTFLNGAGQQLKVPLVTEPLNPAKKVLLNFIEGGIDNRRPTLKEVQAALIYFHGVPPVLAKSIGPSSIIWRDRSNIQVKVSKHSYTITFTRMASPSRREAQHR
jgi:hypothetical protein